MSDNFRLSFAWAPFNFCPISDNDKLKFVGLLTIPPSLNRAQ